MRPPDPLGEQTPWPYISDRHSSHARVRRACAYAAGFGAVVLVSYFAVSHLAAWVADRIVS